MKFIKSVIGTAFFAGLLGMFLAMCALESGMLGGVTYWATISSCAVLSGGAILAAKAAYDYEEKKNRS